MRVAVIGAGVIGLSTTLALRDAGVDVTCYEAVAPLSQRSTGQSRIFRLAHADPALVGLARTSLERFRRWSAAAGTDLVRPGGTVINGPRVAEWAAAMSAAGAAYDLVDPASELVNLPTSTAPGPLLVDHAGGVIDAAALGRYLAGAVRRAVVLDRVHHVEVTGSAARVRGDHGQRSVDVAVIAAGAETAQLAAQVGLHLPAQLAHHVRFTFPLADRSARPQCLIEKSESWRAGFTTYQHLVEPGRWAIGAHLEPHEVAWERGRDAVTAHSRRLVREYVRTNLRGVGDQPVEELYCTMTTGWGDGYTIARNERVIALHGDNLFKLAPVIGEVLCEAALTGRTPEPVRADPARD